MGLFNFVLNILSDGDDFDDDFDEFDDDLDDFDDDGLDADLEDLEEAVEEQDITAAEQDSSQKDVSFDRKWCPTRHGCTGATNCDHAYGAPHNP